MWLKLMKKCFSLLRNSLTFVLNYFLRGNITRLPKGTLGKSRQVSAWLGTPGYTLTKVGVSHTNFPW